MKQLSFAPTIAGAEFSRCRRYRYRLWRVWGPPDGRRVCWVMLNPSTADERKLDPTCTRCAKYSQRWGYDGMVVANIFAQRSTDPRALYGASDPIGPENDRAILQASSGADLVVAAWGNHGQLHGRGAQVLELLGPDVVCLGLTQPGQPLHPLYLRGDVVPRPIAEYIGKSRRSVD